MRLEAALFPNVFSSSEGTPEREDGRGGKREGA